VSAISAARAGRVLAERNMLDTVTIVRKSETFNETTGDYDIENESIYAGRARVQTYEPQTTMPEAGGHTYMVQTYSVHIPVGSADVAIGDVITVTAAAIEPNLVGREYRVVGLLHKSLQTAYRLQVTEISG